MLDALKSVCPEFPGEMQAISHLSFCTGLQNHGALSTLHKLYSSALVGLTLLEDTGGDGLCAR